MRALSIYAAILGVIAWLGISFGGVGGIMYVGLLIETTLGRDSPYIAWLAWPTFVVVLAVWWGSLVLVATSLRTFFRWASELPDSNIRIAGEWSIRLGHLCVVLAGVNALVPHRLLDVDFVYGFLLLAGLSYGAGIIHAALTARSTRTPTGGQQLAAGGRRLP